MKTLAPDTAKLLADVTGQQPARDEAPDERLARLEKDPAKLFAAINLLAPPASLPDGPQENVRAAITATLMPVHAVPERPQHSQPVSVMRALQETAPAVATPASNEEAHTAPFIPSADDRDEAIEVQPFAVLPVRELLSAVVICALMLVIVFQFG